MASSLALIQKVRSLQRLRASRQQKPSTEVPRRPKTIAKESILDFMERVSLHLIRPDHFRVYAEKLETAVGGGHRLVCAAPPQHGKTQVTLHGLCWLILRYPDKRHAYVTYSQFRARSVARTVRRILAAAGVVVSGTLDHMVLPG